LHTPPTQSLAALQPLPFAHFVQLEPQSVSVSVPFFTLSSHVGVAHLPAVHIPLWQSADTRQFLLEEHPGQVPPQSRSVSLPFFTPSAQPARHRFCEHESLTQSEFFAQPTK
jgi:hypothetical protein